MKLAEWETVGAGDGAVVAWVGPEFIKVWTPEPAKVGIAARMVHRWPERDLAAAASAATMRPMADIWTKAKRSEVMARIRGRGTARRRCAWRRSSGRTGSRYASDGVPPRGDLTWT